ncbi:MAG: zinc ribbon domain-containing protein [Mogibacterium sp.]|nr:zinc ribbon domain-containing protein [Mogibacterium sp.]
MICQKCGTICGDTDLFCGVCGAKLQVRNIYTKPFETEATVIGDPSGDYRRQAEANAAQAQAQNRGPVYGAAPGPNDPGQGYYGAQGGQTGGASQMGAKVFEAARNINIKDKIPAGMGEWLKLCFTKPMDAVRYGEEHDNFVGSIIGLCAKDLLFAVLGMSVVANLMSVLLDGYVGSMISQMVRNSGVKVFFILLITLLLIDAGTIMAVYGIGKLFHGKANVKTWVGSVGACFILPGAIQLVVLLICRSEAMLVVGTLALVFAGTLTIVMMFKAFEEQMGISGNSLIMGFATGQVASTTVSTIIIYIVLRLVVQSIQNSYYNYF